MGPILKEAPDDDFVVVSDTSRRDAIVMASYSIFLHKNVSRGGARLWCLDRCLLAALLFFSLNSYKEKVLEQSPLVSFFVSFSLQFFNCRRLTCVFQGRRPRARARKRNQPCPTPLLSIFIPDRSPVRCAVGLGFTGVLLVSHFFGLLRRKIAL